MPVLGALTTVYVNNKTTVNTYLLLLLGFFLSKKGRRGGSVCGETVENRRESRKTNKKSEGNKVILSIMAALWVTVTLPRRRAHADVKSINSFLVESCRSRGAHRSSLSLSLSSLYLQNTPSSGQAGPTAEQTHS